MLVHLQSQCIITCTFISDNKNNTNIVIVINNSVLTMVVRQKVEGFFRSFDMFAAPASLRAKGSSSITRTSAGVISFILFCYFAYIFISGIYQIFTYESIISSQTFNKIPLTSIYAENFMFGIGNMNFDNQVLATEFDIMAIIKSNKNGSIENVTMIPCKSYQWMKLGEDYEQQFKLHYLDKFVCPDKPQKLKLINSSFLQDSVYFQIMISPKNLTFSPTIRDKLKNLQDREANKFNLFFLDQAVIPNEEEAVQYFINIDHFAYVSPFKQHKTLIRLSNFHVKTDYSVLPIIKYLQEIKGLNIADAVLYDIDSTIQNENSKITFQLTNDMMIYSRKVGKIDEMFSYAGGLFALTIWILAFFVSSFNRQRYELMVAETIFNYDKDGHKVMENQFNIVKYVKFSFYNWLQEYFFYKAKWEDCRKIEDTLNEANHQMDVTRLFRKLQFLQMALIHSGNESENLVVALAEPRSLQQVKQQRMILQYYFYVIKGEPAATVGDARDGNAKRFHNLTVEPTLKTTQSQIQNSADLSNLQRPLIQPDNEIKQKLMEYLELKEYEHICQAISKYPLALTQAQNMKLPPQLEIVEEHMTQHFLKLRPFVKIKVMNKIPLKIIHRLCMKSQQMKQKQKKADNLAQGEEQLKEQ